jgi:hypothetical protein
LSQASRKVILPAIVMVIVCVLCAYIPELITGVPRLMLPKSFLR